MLDKDTKYKVMRVAELETHIALLYSDLEKVKEQAKLYNSRIDELNTEIMRKESQQAKYLSDLVGSQTTIEDKEVKVAEEPVAELIGREG